MLTGREGLRNLLDCLAELKCGLGVFKPAICLGYDHSSCNIVGRKNIKLMAGLNLGQVHMTGHAEEKARQEYGGFAR